MDAPGGWDVGGMFQFARLLSSMVLTPWRDDTGIDTSQVRAPWTRLCFALQLRGVGVHHHCRSVPCFYPGGLTGMMEGDATRSIVLGTARGTGPGPSRSDPDTAERYTGLLGGTVSRQLSQNCLNSIVVSGRVEVVCRGIIFCCHCGRCWCCASVPLCLCVFLLLLLLQYQRRGCSDARPQSHTHSPRTSSDLSPPASPRLSSLISRFPPSGLFRRPSLVRRISRLGSCVGFANKTLCPVPILPDRMVVENPRSKPGRHRNALVIVVVRRSHTVMSRSQTHT